jgi:hypothetical protein
MASCATDSFWLEIIVGKTFHLRNMCLDHVHGHKSLEDVYSQNELCGPCQLRQGFRQKKISGGGGKKTPQKKPDEF